MGFGTVTTTGGGAGFQHQTFSTTRPGDFGGYDTPASGGGTTSGNGGTVIIPGPWLCVETNSELMIHISLSIEQSIYARPTFFGPGEGGPEEGNVPVGKVSFGIFGEVEVTGKSKRECMPKKAAEAEVAASQGCTSLVHQKYTAVSMGGNPTIVVPIGGPAAGWLKGSVGRLFGWGRKWHQVHADRWMVPKPGSPWYRTEAERLWKYQPRQVTHPTGMRVPPTDIMSETAAGFDNFMKRGGAEMTFAREIPGKMIFRPQPRYRETLISWKKGPTWWRDWDGTAMFLAGFGSYNHNFGLDIGYIKNCGAKICFDCDAPDGTTTTTKGKICKDKEYKHLIPIEITGTMPLEDWQHDQGTETSRDGYLVFNDPYWYSGRVYPNYGVTRVIMTGWQLFDWTVGETVATNPLVASEGPGYARYPGFGADIFGDYDVDWERQNSVSQGLQQIGIKLREVLRNAVSTSVAGVPILVPADTDIFCGDMSLTDANIESIIKDFQDQWKEQSRANDKVMLGPYQGPPPPPGGNVPGMSEGY